MIAVSIFLVICIVLNIAQLIRNMSLKNSLRLINFESESKISAAVMSERDHFMGEKLELEKKLISLNEKINSLNENLESEKNLKKDLLDSLKNDYEQKILQIHIDNENQKRELRVDFDTRLKEQDSQFRENLENNINLLKEQFKKDEVIFREKIKDYIQENGKNLKENTAESLKPFWEDIAKFKEELAKNEKENREKQIIFSEQIKSLVSQSDKISKEANNLAQALKQDKKMQGNWGEMVLENILLKSGLEIGRDYSKQKKLDTEEGRLFADFIINLPHNRFVALDSKVSLINYEKLINEENNEAKNRYFNDFIKNVKSHISTLSIKQYHNYTDGERLDYTIMFVPIEGAYFEILRDNNLMLEAFSQNVLITSPTTLMATLRIINILWINDKKDKNIQNILHSCKMIVSKFEGFSRSVDQIGDSIKKAQDSYTKAKMQLENGQGSVGSHIEKIKNYMNKVDYKSAALLE